MKALVFNGPKDIRYESFPDPTLKTDNSVILKVEKCSICGSDLHMYHGDNIGSDDYSKGVDKFCVGHEFIGEIVECGPSVHSFKIGDRVLASGGTGCGACQACLTGQHLKCAQATAFGLSADMHGGQAEFVNVPNADQALHIIPDGISDEQALLLTDAMVTASFGVSRLTFKQGDSVAVVGLGPIGIIGVELAFALGASRVFAIDPIKARREKAKTLGAQVFEPGSETHKAIISQTRGGVHGVFEASGVKAAVHSTLKIVRPGGTISCIGLPQADVLLPLNMILYKDITLRAGIAPVPELWAGLIPMLQNNRLKTDGLFSHYMPLSDGQQAYRIFDNREDDVIKIMMTL